MGLKTILVTGSNGLLGQKLVHLIIEEYSQYKLIACSRGENRIKQIEEFIYKDVDITNSKEVEQLFVEFQPDIVINTAAMTNVDQCEIEQEACWRTNVEAVENLIQESKKYNSHLIHLSTDFIFDGEKGMYKENDEVNPLSYYGKSKVAAEELLKKSKITWAIARTIIVYGVAESMSRSNIVLWAREALQKGDKLNIVNDQFRSPTLAEDLANGCMLIAEKAATGIFHLSGKDYMSISQLVKRMAAFYKLDDSIIEEVSSKTLNQKAKRPPKTGFDLTKSINLLGYNPHSFEEGLAILEKQL